jgi:hypothetical protein
VIQQRRIAEGYVTRIVRDGDDGSSEIHVTPIA